MLPGALPLTMTSDGLTAVASAISPIPMAMRVIGLVKSTRADFPTVTERSFEVSVALSVD